MNNNSFPLTQFCQGCLFSLKIIPPIECFNFLNSGVKYCLEILEINKWILCTTYQKGWKNLPFDFRFYIFPQSIKKTFLGGFYWFWGKIKNSLILLQEYSRGWTKERLLSDTLPKCIECQVGENKINVINVLWRFKYQ